MSSWAYACRPCRGEGLWYVPREAVDEMRPEVSLLRVKVGDDWLCAKVDRRRALAVEGLLLREAVASSASDCPECAVAEQIADAEKITAPTVAAAAPPAAAGSTVQAAAISLLGRRFVVVLVPLDLVRQPGEADMLAADLKGRFGGADIVLMGQGDDGSPEYHGSAELKALLADVPVDRMPWHDYPLR